MWLDRLEKKPFKSVIPRTITSTSTVNKIFLLKLRRFIKAAIKPSKQESTLRFQPNSDLMDFVNPFSSTTGINVLTLQNKNPAHCVRSQAPEFRGQSYVKWASNGGRASSSHPSVVTYYSDLRIRSLKCVLFCLIHLTISCKLTYWLIETCENTWI